MTELQKSIQKIIKQTGKNKTDVIMLLLQEQTSILTNVEDKIRKQLSFADSKKLIALLNNHPKVSLDDKIFAGFFTKGEMRKIFHGDAGDTSKMSEISLVKIHAQEYREKLAVYEELMQELLNESNKGDGSKQKQPGDDEQ